MVQWFSGLTQAGRAHLQNLWNTLLQRVPWEAAQRQRVTADMQWWSAQLGRWSDASGAGEACSRMLTLREVTEEAVAVASDAGELGVGFSWTLPGAREEVFYHGEAWRRGQQDGCQSAPLRRREGDGGADVCCRAGAG